jgi:hypothetical protein
LDKKIVFPTLERAASLCFGYWRNFKSSKPNCLRVHVIFLRLPLLLWTRTVGFPTLERTKTLWVGSWSNVKPQQAKPAYVFIASLSARLHRFGQKQLSLQF